MELWEAELFERALDADEEEEAVTGGEAGGVGRLRVGRGAHSWVAVLARRKELVQKSESWQRPVEAMRRTSSRRAPLSSLAGLERQMLHVYDRLDE